MPLAHIRALDNLVLVVSDLDATVAFYTNVLGMQHFTFSNPAASATVRHALRFGNQTIIKLHCHGGEPRPKPRFDQLGFADLCFVVDDDVDVIAERLRDQEDVQVAMNGEVVTTIGPEGTQRSVYVLDPDRNLIKLSNMVPNRAGETANE